MTRYLPLLVLLSAFSLGAGEGAVSRAGKELAPTERIQRALATVMKGRTTFVIAHRLTTVQGADQTLVLE